MSFYDPKSWKYIKVHGLGLIKGIHCPHYNSRTLGVPRRKLFREMIGKGGGTGIALEDNCALECIDGKLYRVITSKSYAGAYKVYRSRGGEVIAERIRQTKEFVPIRLLYERPV